MYLCLIEDDELMGESLVDRFVLEGFQVDWHKTATSAMEAIRRISYGIIISDIQLPDLSGEEMFRKLLEQEPYLPPTIFITAYGSIERAVRLLKLGATDYVTKPFDLGQFVDKLRSLCQQHLPITAPETATHQLGVSESMRKLERLLPRIAARASTVLITGESGVGKEVVAREIHELAPKSIPQAPPPGRFVAVNAAALPESLLEAELFGHEKGAFTGADRVKRGYFELADGGTLFLDEIGDLSPLVQTKLLRVLQDRQITRVGGEAPIRVSLRLICATHRNLSELVQRGAFREDLFYRINLIHLRVPPLRARPEDVVWLARRILAELAVGAREAPRRLHPSTEAAMARYPWPGNVRELRHRLERACILDEGTVLMPQALFGDETDILATGTFAESDTLDKYLYRCERLYIEHALEECERKVGRTAEKLGISRKTLWEKMRRHGLHADAD